MQYWVLAISLILTCCGNSVAQVTTENTTASTQAASEAEQAELVELRARLTAVDELHGQDKKIKSWLVLAVVVGSLLGFVLGSLMTWFAMKSSRQLMERL